MARAGFTRAVPFNGANMTRKAFLLLLAAAAILLAPSQVSFAASPTSQPATARSAADTDLDHLRAALSSAYNRGDIDAMLIYLHPDAVIIFPDGRILNGREGLRDYYNRMLKAPDHIVASFSAEPNVLSRTIHGDVALSYGMLNDKYVLTDGKSFALDSRFTVTLLKSPAGPPESGGWMIRSFHASTDAFSNPILKFATVRAFWTAGIGGAAIGLALGVILVLIVGRSKRRQAAKPA